MPKATVEIIMLCAISRNKMLQKDGGSASTMESVGDGSMPFSFFCTLQLNQKLASIMIGRVEGGVQVSVCLVPSLFLQFCFQDLAFLFGAAS